MIPTEDIFYTPLNKKYAGKTIPDMYGIIIHANIISMIISRDYIDPLPGWINILMAILICYMVVAIVKNIKLKYSDLFDVITILIIFTSSIILLFLSLEIFLKLQLKISLTITLISLVLVPDTIDFYENISKKTKPSIHKLTTRIKK